MKKIALLLIVITLGAFSVKAIERADSVGLRSECEFTLRRSLVGAVTSVAITGVLTEVLKDNIKEARPDGNGDHSFPSRHASFAFSVASISSHELSHFSPLWVSASHTLANAVAMQRVYAERHYPGDVLAGAALGIVSTELGYCISNWIFSGDRCRIPLVTLYNTRSISTSTEALITMCSHSGEFAVGCGIESSIFVGFPISEFWGLGASMRMRSHPVYSLGEYIGALNGGGISVGAYSCRSFGYWHADAYMALGVIYNFDRPRNAAASFCPLFDLSAGIYRSVARRLSIGSKIGLDITERPSALCALTVSIVAKAEF